MARLLADFRRTPDDAIGGIPVDSEYVVFVVDTSRSMRIRWDFVTRKFEEVLDVYPTVQGLQVVNDNGIFMFPELGQGWLQDTRQMRNAVKDTMRQWEAPSDSNPADGLAFALLTFSDPSKKVSIYVFGDDFTGDSADAVVRQVGRINLADADGNRPVRIHAIGFPRVQAPAMGRKYAGLMRVITAQNGGTFVGLTEHD